MNTMDALLGGLLGDAGQQEMAHTLASLPMWLGGLGACGTLGVMGGRIDMIAERLPAVADHVEAQLAEEGAPRGSVGELKECTSCRVGGTLVRVLTTSLESGTTAGSTMLLPLPNTTEHGVTPGPGSSNVLSGAPTGSEFRVCPELFRTLVVERLRLPLEVVESQCECGRPGHSGETQSRMSEVRQIEDKSRPPRENNGTHLQGGRSHSAVQHASA